MTAEASDIAAAWWDQLAPGGHLVAPVRLHSSGLTRSLGFALDEHGVLTSTHAEVCGFVPMRGASTVSSGHVQLATGVALRIDPDDQPDHPALSDAFDQTGHQYRTGIQVHDDQPARHLDLWLLTHTAHPFGRLAVSATARTRGLADPARRWAGAGIYHGGTVAYVTAHPVTDTLDELGVIAHGPDAAELADDLADLLHAWDRHRPAQPIVTRPAHHGHRPGSLNTRTVAARPARNPVQRRLVTDHRIISAAVVGLRELARSTRGCPDGPGTRLIDFLLPGSGDFYVFDDRLALFLHYAGSGTNTAFEITEDPATVRLCRDTFAAAWARSVPASEYRPQ